MSCYRMGNWFHDRDEALAQARFRADITGYRYRVFYDPGNQLWNIRETHRKLIR